MMPPRFLVSRCILRWTRWIYQIKEKVVEDKKTISLRGEGSWYVSSNFQRPLHCVLVRTLMVMYACRWSSRSRETPEAGVILIAISPPYSVYAKVGKWLLHVWYIKIQLEFPISTAITPRWSGSQKVCQTKYSGCLAENCIEQHQ